MANRLSVALLAVIFSCSYGCTGGDDDHGPVLRVNFDEINMCSKKAGETHAWQNLQLMNTGGSALTISNIEIRGDANCAFKCFREPADSEPENQIFECSDEHENSAPFAMTIQPSRVKMLKIEYTPSQAGITDRAALAITSDARNFLVSSEAVDGSADDYTWQKRIINMCGSGIDEETADAGCDDAGCGDLLTADAPGCGEI